MHALKFEVSRSRKEHMSRILVAVTPIPGHVNPLLTVAEHLKDRGHHVIFHCSDVYRDRAESAGLEFVPLVGLANYDYRRMEEAFPGREATEPGMPRLVYDFKYVFGDLIPDQLKGLRQVIEMQAIDVVLTDHLFFGTFPMLLGPREERPLMIACGVIPYLRSIPEASPFTGPDDTPEGLLRNAEHNRMFDESVRPGIDHISDVLERCGSSCMPEKLLQGVYGLPDVFLQFTVEEFEYSTKARLKNLHFVGPMLPKSSAEKPEWLEKLDGSKPVVFVTQGTLANFDLGQLVKPAIAALAEEQVQVVITTGGGDLGDTTIPSNVIVESFVPYELILAKADVLLTNGGYGGVHQALTGGVPIVSGGATEDKPFVSARVAWSGAGIDLKTGAPTPDQIRMAVLEVLGDPRYRARARELQKSFAGIDGLEGATAVIEAKIAESKERMLATR
jgi:MGT family glycosyltransferase